MLDQPLLCSRMAALLFLLAIDYVFLMESRSYNETHTREEGLHPNHSRTQQGLKKFSKRKQEAAKKKWTALIQQSALLFETKKTTIQDSN